MNITDLKRKKRTRVMGIDCSTHSLAFAIFDGKKPHRCGEIMFNGSNLYERLHDAHQKVPALVKSGVLKADYVVFEGAIVVGNNVRTGLSLAYVFGAVIGALMEGDMEVVTVSPLIWQSYIGNKNLTKIEKDRIRRENPGKTDSWYKNAGRQIRKQKTLDFAKQHFQIPTNSDNVGDSVGIAWYAANHLTK